LTGKRILFILAGSARLPGPLQGWNGVILKGRNYMAGILQQFQIGQKVCIKDAGSAWYVAVISSDQAGPVVTEINPEYVVFDDEAAGVMMRIPTYLIRVGEVPEQPVPAAA
jgi:hypothetical protein